PWSSASRRTSPRNKSHPAPAARLTVATTRRGRGRPSSQSSGRSRRSAWSLAGRVIPVIVARKLYNSVVIVRAAGKAARPELPAYMITIERFTEQAQEVLRRAQEPLLRLGQRELDPTHLLLALVEQPDGLVPMVCARLGVDAAALGRRVRALLVNRASRTAPQNTLYIT